MENPGAHCSLSSSLQSYTVAKKTPKRLQVILHAQSYSAQTLVVQYNLGKTDPNIKIDGSILFRMNVFCYVVKDLLGLGLKFSMIRSCINFYRLGEQS